MTNIVIHKILSPHHTKPSYRLRTEGYYAYKAYEAKQKAEKEKAEKQKAANKEAANKKKTK